MNGRAVVVNVTEQDSVDVWGGSNPVWSSSNHPVVWIPEANYTIGYANETTLNYAATIPTLAKTPIIWGIYQDRDAVLQTEYGTFSADAVQQATIARRWQEFGGNSRWGEVTLAFSRPDTFGSGLATLFTFAGEFGETDTLNATLLNGDDFQTWAEEIVLAVPNFSTLNSNPPSIMATRGHVSRGYWTLARKPMVEQLHRHQ